MYKAECKLSVKSCMFKRSRDPRRDPSETPVSILAYEECWPFKTTFLPCGLANILKETARH